MGDLANQTEMKKKKGEKALYVCEYFSDKLWTRDILVETTAVTRLIVRKGTTHGKKERKTNTENPRSSSGVHHELYLSFY